ncbi:hypothetical protein PG990_003554 [Apiospora arundinis]
MSSSGQDFRSPETPVPSKGDNKLKSSSGDKTQKMEDEDKKKEKDKKRHGKMVDDHLERMDRAFKSGLL